MGRIGLFFGISTIVLGITWYLIGFGQILSIIPPAVGAFALVAIGIFTAWKVRA